MEEMERFLLVRRFDSVGAPLLEDGGVAKVGWFVLQPVKSTGGGLDDGRVGRADSWGCGSDVLRISGETEVALLVDGEPS